MLAALAAAGCGGKNGGTIEASGTIEGTRTIVSAEVAGKVARIAVDEGSPVRRGDTLLVIDDTEYRIQVRQAAANAEAADAQYRLSLEGSRKEDVLQAEALFRNAEGDYRRMKDLLASGTATQKQFDDALARYLSAQQTYEKLVRGLRKEEIASMRARRDQAAAAADLARKKADDCIVRSPAQGVVTLRAVEPGELVPAGGQLVQVTALDDVDLMIYVDESRLGGISLGQKAEVFIDSFPGRAFEGRVVFIAPGAEFTPKNVQTKEERTKLVFGVKIRVKNRDGALKPGLPADARLTPGAAG
jgi:HlyD family secretion protein